MENTRSIHQPFEQLPVEARGMFFICASAALASYQSYPPRYSELASHLATAWNAHRLTYEDLADFRRMSRLLKDYFAQLLGPTHEALQHGDQ